MMRTTDVADRFPDRVPAPFSTYTLAEIRADLQAAGFADYARANYGIELSVDEAIAAGATRVNFSQPVISYVENFLDFPVGIAVGADGTIYVLESGTSDNSRLQKLVVAGL